jgi:hypothetical protein
MSIHYGRGPNNSKLTVPTATFNVEYLVVAGGGAGGYKQNDSGGGGAGGLRSSHTGDQTGGGGSLESPATIKPNFKYDVIVGEGGVASDGSGSINWGKGNGKPSSFYTINAVGGGQGGDGDPGNISNSSGPPQPGGSGGGGSDPTTPFASRTGANGIAGQGFKGGDYVADAGGGGGAGQEGSEGDGGDGVRTTIISSSQALAESVGDVISLAVWFAGGGAGGADGFLANGGRGGGGDEDNNGTVNTGGGGGGTTAGTGAFGKNGGSGIVILKYPNTYQMNVFDGNLTGAFNLQYHLDSNYLVSIFKFGSGRIIFESV